MTACIVGWSHLPFGKREGDDVESMIVKVAADAVADAGFEPADVDAV
ncbi:MAG: thiolase domain-containing protein, partial [Proteobacteria bacterium]|nr:thiolase domain-containing protein [Pseudomonadota bacterium]